MNAEQSRLLALEAQAAEKPAEKVRLSGWFVKR